jgi:hypothetical protein
MAAMPGWPRGPPDRPIVRSGIDDGGRILASVPRIYHRFARGVERHARRVGFDPSINPRCGIQDGTIVKRRAAGG